MMMTLLLSVFLIKIILINFQKTPPGELGVSKLNKEESKVARIEAEEKVMHMMITLEYCLMRSLDEKPLGLLIRDALRALWPCDQCRYCVTHQTDTDGQITQAYSSIMSFSF